MDFMDQSPRSIRTARPVASPRSSHSSVASSSYAKMQHLRVGVLGDPFKYEQGVGERLLRVPPYRSS